MDRSKAPAGCLGGRHPRLFAVSAVGEAWCFLRLCWETLDTSYKTSKFWDLMHSLVTLANSTVIRLKWLREQI